MDTAFLRFIPEGDPDLTTYLNELLRTNKTEQHKNLWFPARKNAGKTDDHTPIKNRILRELHEMKEKEKMNLKFDKELQMKFLKRFDWTNTLLMETEKQAAVDFLVEYNDVFARLAINIGMNAEFFDETHARK